MKYLITFEVKPDPIEERTWDSRCDVDYFCKAIAETLMRDRDVQSARFVSWKEYEQTTSDSQERKDG